VPQSLAFNLVHVIFSTKNRRPLLAEPVLADVHAYLATVTRGTKCDCLRVGGVADHVHLAIRVHPERNVSKLISELKTSSSRWLKTQEPDLEKFAWQRGYGAFSVSPADAGAMLRYIDAQEVHHRKRSFQDEMRVFFEKYHVAFDERFVWD